MSENIKKCHELLTQLVWEYFLSGEMPVHMAGALALIAKAYIDEEVGQHNNRIYIELFEAHPEKLPIIFPDEEAMQMFTMNMAELAKCLTTNQHERTRMTLIGADGEIVIESDDPTGTLKGLH